MKITDRMVGDHKTFRKMMSDLDAIAAGPLDPTQERRLVRLVDLFIDHLVIHAWGEETFFYPVVREAAQLDPSTKFTSAYMDQLDNEHEAVDKLLYELESEVKTTPVNSTWTRTYADFKQGLVAHMDKEEKELFPLSEKLLGEAALEKMSLELERNRASAPRARLHAKFEP